MSAPASRKPPEVGWEASLSLRLARLHGRTRLIGRRHRGPLLVQRALHPELPESGCCHLYLVHPPGGVVAGDRLELDARLEPGAHALITTPAATKFYRRADDAPMALQRQQLALDDATLEWLPQENIFFPNAFARVTTCVRLRGGSRFIGWEVGCFGLPASGRDLDAGRVSQGLELWRGEQPLLFERLRVDGSAAAMRGRWGLAGNPATGTLLAYPASESDLHCVRERCEESGAPQTAATLVDRLLVCRMLAARASQVREQFVAIWCVLRPRLLGREASVPRIWST